MQAEQNAHMIVGITHDINSTPDYSESCTRKQKDTTPSMYEGEVAVCIAFIRECTTHFDCLMF
jgi:hypothetical protein